MEKEKFNWKRFSITLAIVLVTAGAVGGSVWWTMNEANKDNEDNIKNLQSQIDKMNEKGDDETATEDDETETDETASWKTYENDDYGFSIKYPSDWVYGRESATYVVIDSSESKFPALESDQPSNIRIDVRDGYTADTCECSEDPYDLSAKNYNDKYVREAVKIGNAYAVKTTILPGAGNRFDGNVKYVYYEVKKGDKYISIQNRSDYELSTFNKMLETLVVN